jgi:hypothetical protein
MIDGRGSWQLKKGTVPIYRTNPRATHAGGCCRSSMTRSLKHRLPGILRTTSQTALPEDGIGRPARPITDLRYPAGEEKSQQSLRTGMTYDRTWIIEQATQDPSTDLEGTPPLDGTGTSLGSTATIEVGNKTGPDQPPIVGMT